jgi:hypothetical protein
MTTRRILAAVALGVLGAGFHAAAFAQGVPTCQPGTGPFDHLKCYKITSPKKVKALADLTPLQPQFPVEPGCKVTGPVAFCVPVCKSNVQPPPPGGVPVGPQEGDHLCYKIACPKSVPTLPAAQDQFGTFPLKFGKAELLCTPAIKSGVPTTSTTTTSSSSSTTTSTIHCRFDLAVNGCIGGCATPGTQCVQLSANFCDCVKPPVCCECGPAPAVCLNTSGTCPASCTTVPNATCDTTTGHCECGSCNDAGLVCNGIPCSTNQPCPGAPTVFCDPNCGPSGPGSGTCDPCSQGGACNPVQCLKADGTPGQCQIGAAGCRCQ